MEWWCLNKLTDPFQCPLKINLVFLVYLSGKCYQYGYINAHRSAITVYHSTIKVSLVGKHLQICALMCMVFLSESHLNQDTLFYLGHSSIFKLFQDKLGDFSGLSHEKG